MSDLSQLFEGNRRFAAHFADGELPIRPRRSTVLLTCLDARVDPAHLFDLQLGDALVIRNAGGRSGPDAQACQRPHRPAEAGGAGHVFKHNRGVSGSVGRASASGFARR